MNDNGTLALRKLKQSADGTLEASQNAEGALWILEEQEQRKEEGAYSIHI